MTGRIHDEQKPQSIHSWRKQGLNPVLPMLLFVTLLTSSLVAAVSGVVRVERNAQQQVNLALAETMSQHESFRIDVDTIRDYRSHIRLRPLRDTAFIAIVPGVEGSQDNVALEARTGLTLVHLWRLSDQRASGTLAALAAISLCVSLFAMRRRPHIHLAVAMRPAGIEGLCYDAATRHFSFSGRELSLTPMQRDLLHLFLQAPDHRLLKQDICEHLWPKKPDASATLYTLIRRLKQTLAESTDVRVECDRGQAYQLK